MKKIPTIIETYTEHGKEPERVLTNEPYEYEFVKGEKILVYYWVKYPSYDFIFGTPHPDNPKYKSEYGFFQFRKMRDGKVMAGWNIYVDRDELEEMQKGFTKLMDVSHATRHQEWAERNAIKTKEGYCKNCNNLVKKNLLGRCPVCGNLDRITKKRNETYTDN